MMSRPMVLVFLLLILIITSQFEWKQQLASEMVASPSISQKHQYATRKEEMVKEKIILLQEKSIQQLNELVQSLQQRLLQCQCCNKTLTVTPSSLTGNINDIESRHFVED